MSSVRGNVGAFEEYVKAMMSDYQAPGVVICIWKDGELAYRGSFGVSSLDDQRSVTEDTVFGIASGTKPFTALAVMQLQERGLLRVDDPVVWHIPELRLRNADATAVTVAHLLTHTSGIPPLSTLNLALLPDGDEDRAVQPAIKTVNEMISYLGTHDYLPLAAPGECFCYCNEGYGLLGEIISLRSGLGYEGYIRKHILEPLGMRLSTFDNRTLKTWDDVTRLYHHQGELGPLEVGWQSAPPLTAAAFMKSSAADLGRFLNSLLLGGANYHPRIIGVDQANVMMQRHCRRCGDSWYGYGWEIAPGLGDNDLVFHPGSLRGMSSTIGLVPNRGLAAVVLCNLGGFPVKKLWLKAVELVGGPVSIENTGSPVAQWAEYKLTQSCGSYLSGTGRQARVATSQDRLTISFGGRAFALDYVSDDTAVLRVGYEEMHIQFLADHKGRCWAISIDGMVWRRNGDAAC
ncbi:MAG: serine hydrolase domain-containing protein [Bacillota bacterium]